MESKAQKAAIARIEQLNSYESSCLSEICDLIDKYNLKEKIDILEKVYDALMKKKILYRCCIFC